MNFFCPACTMSWVINMRIEIIYEDEALTVCMKLPGLDSQKDMSSLLREQLGGEVFCVHRLDKEVGGLMVYARSSSAAAVLSAAMAGGKFFKEYLAVSEGCPEEPEGLMQDLLFRDAAKNKSYVVKRQRRGVRRAELEYKLLERSGDKCLFKIKLHTGRSHQIRVQFASRGLPLLGDAKYGSRERRCNIALWSCRLAFPHPVSGRSMEFSARPEPGYPWDKFQSLN